MEKADSRSSSEFQADDSLLEGQPLKRTQRSSLCRLQVVFYAAALIYILVTLPLLAPREVLHVPRPHSPANNLVSFELHPLLFHEYDPRFQGSPEETDPHWRHLLEPMNIRVNTDELKQAHANMSDDLVILSDGQYPASLAIYHELHCLDSLRKNLDKDYYFSSLTEEEKAFNNFHQRHCIESLRRTLMCKADDAFYASYWIAPEGTLPSKELRSNSQQTCSNWDKIDAWARDRMLEKHVFLVKPGPFDQSRTG